MVHSFMHRNKWVFAPLIIAGLIAFGYITMWLWNYTIPVIFNLPAITFWQAVCLLILSRIFFGGRHSHNRMSGRSWGLRRKLSSMTPEEKEAFFKKLHHSKHYCGEDFYKSSENPAE